MSDVKLQRFISKKAWRGYNGEKVLKIREQYPDIDPYLHTEIVLDWISAKKPRQMVVTDFWDCSVQLYLNSVYQDLMRQHLSARKYEVSYVCRTHEVGELQTCQSFTLDNTQIADLIEGQCVQLRNTCNFGRFCESETDHVVNIKLEGSPTCSVLIDDASSPVDGHAHLGYKHWFIIKPESCELVSLCLSSIGNLTSLLKKSKQCKLYALMLH